MFGFGFVLLFIFIWFNFKINNISIVKSSKISNQQPVKFKPSYFKQPEKLKA